MARAVCFKAFERHVLLLFADFHLRPRQKNVFQNSARCWVLYFKVATVSKMQRYSKEFRNPCRGLLRDVIRYSQSRLMP